MVFDSGLCNILHPSSTAAWKPSRGACAAFRPAKSSGSAAASRNPCAVLWRATTLLTAIRNCVRCCAVRSAARRRRSVRSCFTGRQCSQLISGRQQHRETRASQHCEARLPDPSPAVPPPSREPRRASEARLPAQLSHFPLKASFLPAAPAPLPARASASTHRASRSRSPLHWQAQPADWGGEARALNHEKPRHERPAVAAAAGDFHFRQPRAAFYF